MGKLAPSSENGVSAGDYPSIQAAIDSGVAAVNVPAGEYALEEPLRLRSNLKLTVHPSAKISAPGFPAAEAAGCEELELSGGIWSGGGENGALMSFIGVKELSVTSMTLICPVAAFVSIGEADGFTVDNLLLRGKDGGSRQDGVRLGGGCRRGGVYDITAEGPAPEGALVSLCADDTEGNLAAFGTVRGEISDITVQNLAADDCGCFIRAVSVTSAIKNVRIDGVYGGCRHSAFLADAMRYCRTPLAQDPGACVGAISGFTVNDMLVRKSGETPDALVLVETDADGLRFTELCRSMEKDCSPFSPTLSVAKLSEGLELTIEGAPEEDVTLTNCQASRGGEIELDADAAATVSGGRLSGFAIAKQ